MNCWTPEAIASYAKATMEARREASEMSAAYAQPGLAARLSKALKKRRLLETFRKALRRRYGERVPDAR